jgi:hypothetical protein
VTSLVITALDAVVRVDVPDAAAPELERSFADTAQHGERTTAAAEPADVVWSPAAGGGWCVESDAAAELVDDVAGGVRALIAELDRRAAASVVHDHTVIRGAAFELDGAAVAVIGDTPATVAPLLAASCRRGGRHVASGVCAVDPDGVVRAYHRPLLVPRDVAAATCPDEAGTDAAGTDAAGPGGGDLVALRPGALGALAGSTPLRAIAFLRHGPDGPEVVGLPAAHALVRLAATNLGVGGPGRDMFRRFDRLVREMPVVELTFGHAEPAAAVLAHVVAVTA